MVSYVYRVRAEPRKLTPETNFIAFGRARDGNLQFGISVGSREPEMLHKMNMTAHTPLAELGGSISCSTVFAGIHR